MAVDDERRARLRGDIKPCTNSGCDSMIRVRPHEEADDHYTVASAGNRPLGDYYCSARCVARGMADEPGVERVNVYDSDDSGAG